MQRLLLTAMLAVFMGIAPIAWAADAQESGQKRTVIRITVGGHVLFATLNNSQTAQDFIATLPRTLPMQRLYDREYYAVLPTALSKEGKAQESYGLGDVAFWTSGDYFGLLFSYDRPKLSAPIIVMGKVTSDLAVFNTLGRAVEMRFEIEK